MITFLFVTILGSYFTGILMGLIDLSEYGPPNPRPFNTWLKRIVFTYGFTLKAGKFLITDLEDNQETVTVTKRDLARAWREAALDPAKHLISSRDSGQFRRFTEELGFKDSE